MCKSCETNKRRRNAMFTLSPKKKKLTMVFTARRWVLVNVPTKKIALNVVGRISEPFSAGPTIYRLTQRYLLTGNTAAGSGRWRATRTNNINICAVDHGPCVDRLVLSPKPTKVCVKSPWNGCRRNVSAANHSKDLKLRCFKKRRAHALHDGSQQN